MQPLQPGDPASVGRYRLGGRLGQGGMGQVYWGRSPSGRPVAIKVVHAHLADQSDFRRRFAHEVDAARRVGGFHTAPVVDADPDGDPPWLVTAYVAGPSLAEAVKRAGRFEASTLRVLGAGLAEALEAVHAAGLVHRDLKPANILLADDGPRVIDFGIARAMDGAEGGGITATGASVGTPRFMAPEQFAGEPLTGAADVFAWGTVLCYAAGEHPFGDGSPATVVGAILMKPPRLDAVPKPLFDVVAAALQKDPAQRPTPTELLDALSDGTSSDGWLPPVVEAMLPEHALPDTTRSKIDVGTIRTQVIDGGRTHRITPPPPQQRQSTTRPYEGQPFTPSPPPPPHVRPQNLAQATAHSPAQSPAQSPVQPRGRRRVVALGLIGAVLLLIIVVVVVALNQAWQGTATSPVLLPVTSSPIAAPDTPTDTPTETTQPTTSSAPFTTYVPPAAPPVGVAAGPVDPASFVGNWKTVEGSQRVIAVSITSEADKFSLSITISDADECGLDGNLTGRTTGSVSGRTLTANWALTCSNGGAGRSTFIAPYTFDPATGRLSDGQGMHYTKQ